MKILIVVFILFVILGITIFLLVSKPKQKVEPEPEPEPLKSRLCTKVQTPCQTDEDCNNLCEETIEGTPENLTCQELTGRYTDQQKNDFGSGKYCLPLKPKKECSEKNGGVLTWTGWSSTDRMEWDCLCTYPNYFGNEGCTSLNPGVCIDGTFEFDAKNGEAPSSKNCTCKQDYIKMIKNEGGTPFCVNKDIEYLNYYSSSSKPEYVKQSCQPTSDPVSCVKNDDCESKCSLDEEEVFAVGKEYNYTKNDAENVCKKYGAKVATSTQLQDAFNKGADWCFAGWVSDSDQVMYPNQYPRTGCGTEQPSVVSYTKQDGEAGVNCYGKKPDFSESVKEIRQFNEPNNFWNFPGYTCSSGSCKLQTCNVNQYNLKGCTKCKDGICKECLPGLILDGFGNCVYNEKDPFWTTLTGYGCHFEKEGARNPDCPPGRQGYEEDKYGRRFYGCLLSVSSLDKPYQDALKDIQYVRGIPASTAADAPDAAVPIDFVPEGGLDGTIANNIAKICKSSIVSYISK
jgi:hypothetical protein